eukprot:6515286-Prymnesium_polylepis.2
MRTGGRPAEHPPGRFQVKSLAGLEHKPWRGSHGASSVPVSALRDFRQRRARRFRLTAVRDGVCK